MISRREFLQCVSAGIAALTTSGISVIEDEKRITSYQGIPIKPVPRTGIEILEGTQSLDADYLQVTILRWLDEKIVAKKTLKYTRAYLKIKYDEFRDVIQKEIQESAQELLALQLE